MYAIPNENNIFCVNSVTTNFRYEKKTKAKSINNMLKPSCRFWVQTKPRGSTGEKKVTFLKSCNADILRQTDDIDE